jgi:hypothetical protein
MMGELTGTPARMTTLEKLRRGNVDFMREIEELRKALFSGYQPPLSVP